MKLSNLSLAVLVALGVAACGGSDDNNNAPQDPPAGNNPGNNGGGNTTPPPAVDNTKPQDPARVAPDMNVQEQVADLVNSRKITYADKGAADLITGYAPNAGVISADTLVDEHGNVYVANSTKPANVKRFSGRVNYAQTNQFYRDLIDVAHPADPTEIFDESRKNGAVIANPGFTYARGQDNRWYRMEPVGVTWYAVTPDTRYQPVFTGFGLGTVDPTQPVDANNPAYAELNAVFPGGTVGQADLFFIPNVVRNEGGDANRPDSSAPLDPARLGNHPHYLAGRNLEAGRLVLDGNEDFLLGEGEVAFDMMHFNGQSYDISQAGKIDKIDLNSIPKNKEKIQYLPVTFEYIAKDDKGTATLVDDKNLKRTAEAGAMKAYQLPYSLAFVTVNQAGAEKGHFDNDGAAARNFFDYSRAGETLGQPGGADTANGDFGAYQVLGYQTPYLPRNGRADYHGKSFGVDSQGDIHLRADFGSTGSHISGSVLNRTRADGETKLADITLGQIQLSNPGDLNTTGTIAFGNSAQAGVARSRHTVGNWHVQLFGPDAEEAGGTIFMTNDAIIPGSREVFSSQRGVLINDSNMQGNQ